MVGFEKRILVTGGTGQQGIASISQFRERGWNVRVLTRDPNSAKARLAASKGAELCVGDVQDRSSLTSAIAGTSAVFCVVPLDTVASGKTAVVEQEVYDRQVRGTSNVVDAAVAANVDHFILSSANSADRNISRNIHNKLRMEEYIRGTPLRATFLRPVSFMDNLVLPNYGLHQGIFTTALMPGTRQQLIAAEDIGVFAAIMLERPHEGGIRILEIAGDDLTPVEMAAALSDALGRRIPYLQISSEMMFRISENAGYTYAKINAGDITIVNIAELKKLHPGLQTMPDWLANQGAEWLRPLLPQRPGGMLAALPAWRLDSLSN